MGPGIPFSRPIDPTGKMLLHEVREMRAPDRIVIQARQVPESLSPFLKKRVPALHLDFLERFQAVRKEPGTHDVDVGDAFAGP
jgi:hypothetical protein